MANIIEIRGGIGDFYNDSGYIDYLLRQMDDNEDLEVRIDSLGGSFVDAISIYHSLKRYKGNTKAIYSGLCASAATIVAAGCDKIEMTDASAILIHKVLNWVDVWGYLNSDDIENVIAELKKQKQDLDTLSSLAASIYAKKTGKTVEEMMTQMKSDSWILPEAAKEMGLVDEVIETQSSRKAEANIEAIENKIKGLELVNNVTLPKFSNSTITKKNNIQMTILDKVKNFFKSNGLDENKAADLVNALGLDADYKNELENVKNELKTLKARDVKGEIETAVNAKIAGLGEIIEAIKSGNETYLNALKADFEKSLKGGIETAVNAKVSEIHLQVTNKIADKDDKNDPTFAPPKNVSGNNPMAMLGKMFTPKS